MQRFFNLELLELPDCKGLADNGRCIWLNINACKGEVCAFKRSASEYKSSHINTFQRLASLSSLEQTHIADKYYNGKKPWNEQSILE